ncbi:MAG: hypothetical protein HYY02_05050 [Chloroflexi bacterium]|nr:hypothetical protein [Chloroflexota bacterium]
MSTPFRATLATDGHQAEALQGDAEALRFLRELIAQGDHWFSALLQAIALWRSPEEEYGGRHFRYLVGGEAFDWLLLAERLCEELGDLAPQADREALLFFGQFPIDVSPWEFQRLIGRSKFRAYLNYWYGVLVEEALLLAVEERLAKERHAVGYASAVVDGDPVYLWVYGAGLQELVQEFRCDHDLPPGDAFTLAEQREFTYWCFKYRLQHRDPAKVASDTRLGLERLQRLRYQRRLGGPAPADLFRD